MCKWVGIGILEYLTHLQDKSLQYALVLVAVLVEILHLGLCLVKDRVQTLGSRSQYFETRLVEGGGLRAVQRRRDQHQVASTRRRIVHFPADFGLLSLLVELRVDCRGLLSDDLGL